MTKRQVKYREYLKSDHWKSLRAEVVARDKACVRCSSGVHLQAHHKFYRGRPEDSLVGDLELLCRKCHQKEHGFGPSTLEAMYRKIETAIQTEQPVTKEDWKAFVSEMIPIEYFDAESMAGFDWQNEMFATLMFRYVQFTMPLKKYGHVSWWMDERGDYWRDRAMAVKGSILGRSPTYDHLKAVYEKRRQERVR